VVLISKGRCLHVVLLLQAAAVPKMAGGADSADAVAAALGDSELLSPEAYRKKYSMWVMPQDAPAPFQTFAQVSEQAQLPPRLLNAVSSA
jgi:hypothetical protein